METHFIGPTSQAMEKGHETYSIHTHDSAISRSLEETEAELVSPGAHACESLMALVPCPDSTAAWVKGPSNTQNLLQKNETMYFTQRQNN